MLAGRGLLWYHMLTCGTVCCVALLQLVGPSHSSAKRRTRPMEAHAARRCEATTKQLAHWLAWRVSPYRMIVFWMAGVWHTFYLEKEPEARFECSLCKFPCFFSAVGCSCNPTTVSCLHHYNKVIRNNHATCPPSALMMKHAHTTHPRSDVLVQALLQVSGELAQD